jgi:uncharacterized protein
MFKKLFGRREAPPAPRPKVFNNLEDARARHPADKDVPSPCISLCKMDDETKQCKGCYRTVDEIAAWSRLDDAQRLVIWERIENHQIAIGQY